MRIKTGSVRRIKHKKWLKRAKGYTLSRKSTIRQAKQAVIKAGQHAFAHRKRKKSDFRRLWIVRINAGLKKFNLRYSEFIYLLKKAKVELDRKSLAQLADSYPEQFEQLVKRITDAGKKPVSSQSKK